MHRRSPKVLLAAALAASAPAMAAEVTDWGIEAGLRQDSLTWDIAGSLDGSEGPNVLSELTFEDIWSAQLSLYGRRYFGFGLYLEGEAQYGAILDGNAQDSDFLADNRGLEFSRSYSTISGDSTLDTQVAVGWQLFGEKLGNLRTGQDSWAFIPMIGYSYHRQNLRMTDGIQEINLVSDFLGPFEGLDSTYEAEFEGPFLGFRLDYDHDLDVGMYAAFKYHWTDYYAEADWNLRDDLAHPRSFEHEADAKGWTLEGGVRLKLTKSVRLLISLTYGRMSADDGIDTVYFSDGTFAQTRLNNADWEQFAIMISPIIRF